MNVQQMKKERYDGKKNNVQSGTQAEKPLSYFSASLSKTQPYPAGYCHAATALIANGHPKSGGSAV